MEKREKLPKYTIYIEALTFFAIIGILEKERLSTQKVCADIEIVYEKKGEDFINYAQVASLVEEVMQREKFFLLEDALEKLSAEIKGAFEHILSLKLRLTKPDILENATVAVEIFKKY